MTTAELRAALRAAAEPERVPFMAPYLGVKPGGYGEGDVLLGVRVPETRRIARRALRARLPLEDTLELLRSDVHEERLLALVVMVERHKRGDAAERRAIHDAYLAHSAHVNNWDLVDISAPEIVGDELLDGPRDLLDRLAASDSVWERRIALLATLRFIRAGQLDDTYRLAERLLHDPHDLIHKAAGWMLREAGARDEPRLIAFLDRHAAAMPRTMLRYALEKVAPGERARLMKRYRQGVLTGSCVCRGVRFEVTQPLMSAGWCHCTRCQHRTGVHASAGGEVAPGSFRITDGEDLITEWTPPGGGFIKAFCSVCGGHLYSRSPDDPEGISVRLGAIDGDPGIRPQYHQFTANAAVWQPLPDDGLPRYEARRP